MRPDDRSEQVSRLWTKRAWDPNLNGGHVIANRRVFPPAAVVGEDALRRGARGRSDGWCGMFGPRALGLWVWTATCVWLLCAQPQGLACGMGVTIASRQAVAGPSDPKSAEAAGLRLATFDLDATPPLGSMMAYDPVKRIDELGLRCRGVVLLGAEAPIVLCAVDWIGIGNEGHDLFRQVLADAAGTTPERVAVHTLHQHDAPRFDASAERLLLEAGVRDLGSFQSGVARDLLRRLPVAIQRGLDAAVPVTHLGVGTAEVQQVASNRRLLGADGRVRATRYTATRDPALRAEPEGVIDPELTSVIFFNEKNPVAVLSYYACHPQSYYRTGVPSPDFPGIARFMHSQDVPSALHVHFNGAGGNLGAGKYNDGSPANRMVLAERLANGMRAAFRTATRVPLSIDDVSWRVEPVHLPVAKHLNPRELREGLSKWRPTEYFGSPDRLAFLLRAESGEPTELSCLGLGSVRLVHLPGELFVEYQLAAKRLRPDLTVAVAAYGDYGPGYIGTEIAYEQGGYETEPRSSNVAPQVEKVLMAGIERLLEASDERGFEQQLPRIPAKEPDAAIQAIEVAEGFEVQLTASEPLIQSPVAMQWDERGDLWVCEMKGYSEHREDQISNLVRLSDRDSDGRFDERQVILEGLKWPTAVFPWAQGVLLVDAPDILFVQDLDADGVFESRRVLLTGLSFSNVQGLANSFRWGLDNRIHLSTSSNGGRVYRPEDGPVAAFDIRGRDLAWDPRTDEWSTTAGGGQHGMAFDDWGRKWVCSNSDHLQQIIFDAYGEIPSLSFNTAPRRVSAAADGPQAEVFRVSRVEPWRILRTRLRVDGLAKGPIEGGGRAAGYFTGATGVNVYRGDAYPETWRDRSGDSSLVVVGDVGGNLIHRKRVTREGILHVGRRIDEGREWVASNDLWFRPAQFENGPDGTLHVIDVYREVIEHPLSLPPQIKPYLDLNAGRDRGRLYRIVPDGFVQPAHRDLGQLDDMGLVELLEHPNAWHRETAARLIYQRQPSSVQVTRRLEELAKSSESPLGRLHALLTLDGLGRRPADVLARTLQDEHPQVRRWAVRLVGDDWPLNLETEAAWLACADDPSPEVQFEWVWSVARRTRDSESGQTPEDRLSAGALESCLQKVFDRIQPSSVDRWMRSAAQATIQERLALFLQVNLSRPDRTDLSIWPMQWLGEVVQSVSRTGGREAIELLRTELPRQVPRPEGAWMAVAASLQQNGGDTATDGLGGNAGPAALEDWIAKVKANVLSEANERVDRARVAIEGDVAPRETWDAVERLKWCTAHEAVPVLLAWIEPSEPMDVQLAALRALAAFDDARVYDRYVDLWEGFGPRSRAMVEEQWFAREKGIARFMAATQAGEISRANLPWSRLEWLSRSNDTQHQPQALELLAWRQRQGQAVDHAHYRSQIPATGDAEVGRQVFERHCAACHQPVGDHSPLAPSLTGVAEKGADYALTHVLQPNLEVHSQYLNYILELSDGRIATGMIVEESAGGLMLARGDGTREAILRSEILAMKSTGQSLMPEGLERSINPVEMGHLLHFLVTGQ